VEGQTAAHVDDERQNVVQAPNEIPSLGLLTACVANTDYEPCDARGDIERSGHRSQERYGWRGFVPRRKTTERGGECRSDVRHRHAFLSKCAR
jgi:hypothetical protein